MRDGEWLLYADVDEFARFPCDVATRMRTEVCSRVHSQDRER